MTHRSRRQNLHDVGEDDAAGVGEGVAGGGIIPIRVPLWPTHCLRNYVPATTCGGMSTTLTMDATGRLVLPLAMRKKLALKAGAKIRAELAAGSIQLTPESAVRLVKKGNRLVVAGFPKEFSAVAAIAEARAEHDERLTDHRKSR